MPEAAKANTPAGAEAFVRYFIDQVNVAWTKPDATALKGLCDLASKSCASFNHEASDLVSKGQKYASAPVTLASLESQPELAGEHRVLMKGQQNRASIVDMNGIVVKQLDEAPSEFVFYLDWKQGAWIITAIRAAA